MTTKRFIAKNGVDNNNQTLENVANPVLGTDAVNKNTADNTANSINGFAQGAYTTANNAQESANTALSSSLAYAIALG